MIRMLAAGAGELQSNRGAGDGWRFRERKRWAEGCRTLTNISEYCMGRRKKLGGKHRHRSMIVWADEDEEDVKRIGPQLEPGEVGQAWGSDENFEGREKEKAGGNREKRALKTCDALPFLSTSAQPLIMHHGPCEPFRLLLPSVFPKKTEYSPRPCRVRLALVPLAHILNSHSMFPRILTVSTRQYFGADICASPTEASIFRRRALRSQLWVATTPMSPSVLAASVAF